MKSPITLLPYFLWLKTHIVPFLVPESFLKSHEHPMKLRFNIPVKFNPHSNPIKNHVNPTWLVVFTIFNNMSNMSQLGLWLSHISWKNKIHVQNHRPDDNPIRQNTQLAIVQPAQPAALRLRPLWHHPRRQRPRGPVLDVVPSAVWGDFWVLMGGSHGKLYGTNTGCWF